MLAADAAAPANMHETQDSLNEVVQLLSKAKRDLESHARSCSLTKNKTIAEAGQGRLARFMGQATLKADKQDDIDGYVTHGVCIAVLFNEIPRGPYRKKQECRVYCGNIAKVTFNKQQVSTKP